MDPDEIQKEYLRLQKENKAFKAQNRLFEILLEMTRSSDDQHMVGAAMKKALEMAAELCGAQKGSLFLLNEKGEITDCLLTREKVSSKKTKRLVGIVLNEGLAGWVKKHRRVGLIKDTETDSRWVSLADQPYAVRSALALPIRRRDALYGILTLMHERPDHFEKEKIPALQMMADQMTLALENAQLYGRLDDSYRSLEKAKQSIEKYTRILNRDLKKGQQIQKEFLPNVLPEIEGYRIETFFQPALQLSGDFYDMFRLPNERFGIVIADVSDKGVGAALLMALVRSLVRIFSGTFTSENIDGGRTTVMIPKDIEHILFAATLANQYIAREHSDDGMFVTLFFAVLEPEDRRLSYVNCGHEPVLVIDKSGIKERLNPVGPALGVFEDITYPVETIQMKSNDILLGFTDGITEARSAMNTLYSRNRLEHSIEKALGKPAGDFLEIIKKELFDFIGKAPQVDDITIFAFQKI